MNAVTNLHTLRKPYQQGFIVFYIPTILHSARLLFLFTSHHKNLVLVLDLILFLLLVSLGLECWYDFFFFPELTHLRPMPSILEK